MDEGMGTGMEAVKPEEEEEDRFVLAMVRLSYKVRILRKYQIDFHS